jgi:hypothetical protein
MSTWQFFVEWTQILAVLFVLGMGVIAMLLAIGWLITRPLGNGPERIVDIENRGHTRIRMPDGTIK